MRITETRLRQIIREEMSDEWFDEDFGEEEEEELVPPEEEELVPPEVDQYGENDPSEEEVRQWYRDHPDYGVEVDDGDVFDDREINRRRKERDRMPPTY